MFTSKLKNIIIASTLALGTFGTLAATSTTAQAETLGGIYLSGPGISIGVGEFRDGRGYRVDRRYRGPRYNPRPRYRHNFCRPGKAVRKAVNRGIRRAHVIRAGHRGVVVAGRKWGERVVIKFNNNRRCSIRSVRAR